MNNEQIPESVISEWRDAANRLKIGHVFEFEVDFYIEGCKSQYPFREKYEQGLLEMQSKCEDNLADLNSELFAWKEKHERLQNGFNEVEKELRNEYKKNKVLRDALEKTTDYAIILKGTWLVKVKDSDQKDKAINELTEAIETAQQALKQTEL